MKKEYQQLQKDEIQMDYNISDNFDENQDQLKPILQNNYNSEWGEKKQLIQNGFSISFCCLCNILIQVINFYYIGKESDAILYSVAGLGFLWMIFIGQALIQGLSYGFQNLASREYGARNYSKIGIYYQKTLVVLLVILMNFCFMGCFTSRILIMLDQDEEISVLIQIFVLKMIPGILFFTLYQINMMFLVAQEICDVPFKVQIISTILHIFYCQHFISDSKLGLDGLIYSMSLTYFTMFFLIKSYILIINPRPDSHPPKDIQNLYDYQEWVYFLKQTIPISASTLLDEATYELTSLIIGFLKDPVYIASHIAMINSVQIIYAFNEGFASAINSCVGNKIGERNFDQAKKLGIFGVSVGILISTSYMLILIYYKDEWASYYSEDEEIKSVLIKYFYYFVFVGMEDVFLLYLNSILKCLNQQHFNFQVMILGLTCDTLGSYMMGIQYGLGYQGVWVAQVIGLCTCVLILTRRLFGMDWETGTYYSKF